MNRSILAAVLVLGTAGAALADVKVNTPGAQVDAPSGPVDLNVNVASDMKPTDAWIGRAVYSIDDKHLGEIAAISGDSVYVDIGGFLGIGETRVLLDNSQLGKVEPDRIVLKLTESEAKLLPPTDADAAAPK
ncbi:MAG: hypothetical protein WC829_19815 [Hyphomicrobium sp.]|jgi:hypothetical protein